MWAGCSDPVRSVRLGPLEQDLSFGEEKEFDLLNAAWIPS